MLRHALHNGHARPPEPPGGVVDVLVASKDGKTPAGLEELEGMNRVMHVTHRVLVDSRPGWAAAANALLDQAAESGHDAIFVDDDVTILPEFFRLRYYYHLADVFGFRLRGRPGQEDQCGWGLQRPNPYPDKACYCAHVTASLMYVRAEVLQAGVRFPYWPGLHFEDLQFTYECWLKGFAVAYLPLPALHDIAPAAGDVMIGATKRNESNLKERREMNHRCFDKWVADNDIRKAADDGRIPFGIWGIDA